MAVYKHRYRGYAGELTPQWQRILVLPRYAYRRVFQSRFFTVFYVLCFLVPVGAAVLIYLRHNLSALELLGLPEEAFLAVDAAFFRRLLMAQGGFAFLMTAFIGPGLVSPDLVNNGLPLYLSRAFSRTDYVVGKSLVLVLLLSSITWLPLSLLFLLQSNLAGGEWLVANARTEIAILVGSAVWIVVLTLLALALSAWVRWRAVAGALFFGIFITGSGFAAAVNEIFATRWGTMLTISDSMVVVWDWLFGDQGEVTHRLRGILVQELPVWAAWLTLGAVCLCCIGLLARRIKAYEVVR